MQIKCYPLHAAPVRINKINNTAKLNGILEIIEKYFLISIVKRKLKPKITLDIKFFY